jgi:hypothetical protein
MHLPDGLIRPLLATVLAALFDQHGDAQAVVQQ